MKHKIKYIALTLFIFISLIVLHLYVISYKYKRVLRYTVCNKYNYSFDQSINDINNLKEIKIHIILYKRGDELLIINDIPFYYSSIFKSSDHPSDICYSNSINLNREFKLIIVVFDFKSDKEFIKSCTFNEDSTIYIDINKPTPIIIKKGLAGIL